MTQTANVLFALNQFLRKVTIQGRVQLGLYESFVDKRQLKGIYNELSSVHQRHFKVLLISYDVVIIVTTSMEKWNISESCSIF